MVKKILIILVLVIILGLVGWFAYSAYLDVQDQLKINAFLDQSSSLSRLLGKYPDAKDVILKNKVVMEAFSKTDLNKLDAWFDYLYENPDIVQEIGSAPDILEASRTEVSKFREMQFKKELKAKADRMMEFEAYLRKHPKIKNNIEKAENRDEAYRLAFEDWEDTILGDEE